jgi:hypothetical protein
VESQTVAVVHPYAFEDPQLLAFGLSESIHVRLGGGYPSSAVLDHQVVRTAASGTIDPALTLRYPFIIHEMCYSARSNVTVHPAPWRDQGLVGVFMEGCALHTSP